MSTIANRGGQAPGHIHDAFIEAIESHCWRVEIYGRHYSIIWLTSLLWDCMDTMPPYACDELHIPRGSTYAQASRHLRNESYRPTPLPDVPPMLTSTREYHRMRKEGVR